MLNFAINSLQILNTMSKSDQDTSASGERMSRRNSAPLTAPLLLAILLLDDTDRFLIT